MAILGIDEVGRGPLAGPLVVGAVILPKDLPVWTPELKDSKKLSVKKRKILAELILAEAAATGLGWVTAKEIDELGIAKGLELATKRAVRAVQKLKIPFSEIIIDGKVNFLKNTVLARFVSTLPKADDLIREVSAASIIAKVARDEYMAKIARNFPGYGFESHVGYGTKKHLEAIFELGICSEHRKSFEPMRTMTGFKSDRNVVKNTTSIGRLAEEKVAELLIAKGHRIIEKNFKTKFCEIDLISIFEDKIYFTEVKYRKTDLRGGGLGAITKQKKRQMEFAAKSFLKFKSEDRLNPVLAVASVIGKDFLVQDWFVLPE